MDDLRTRRTLNRVFATLILFSGLLVLAGCGGSGGSGGSTTTANNDTPVNDPVDDDPIVDPNDPNALDITNQIFETVSGVCTDYVNSYVSSVLDVTRSLGFDGAVSITSDGATCSLTSNNIPNHDFNDASASFANQVAEVTRTFEIPVNPQAATNPTQLRQQTWDAVMLNGVVVDLLSAGCYNP